MRAARAKEPNGACGSFSPPRLRVLRHQRSRMQADVPADGQGDRAGGRADVPADDPDGREDVPDDGARVLLHQRLYQSRRHEPGAANRDELEAR